MSSLRVLEQKLYIFPYLWESSILGPMKGMGTCMIFSLENYGSMEYQGRKIHFYIKSIFNIYSEYVKDPTWGHQFFSVKYFKFI